MRKRILFHTDPNKKYDSWLEPQDGNLSPNEKLVSTIKQFADEFIQETDRANKNKNIIVSFVISLTIILLFELLVYKIPIKWVTNHPNSYGIQGSVIFLIPCLTFGYLKPKWRKWCWGTAGLAFLVLILTLLGGKSN